MASQLFRPAVFTVIAALSLSAIAACNSDDDDPAPVTGPVSVEFTATLNAANERQANPVNSSGTGTATVVQTGTEFAYTVNYSGLTGSPTLAHIHGPADASVSTGVMVAFNPSSASGTSGSFSGRFIAADILSQGGRPPVSVDSLVALMKSGNVYVNVHTAQYPAGEIRGQLRPK